MALFRYFSGVRLIKVSFKVNKRNKFGDFGDVRLIEGVRLIQVSLYSAFFQVPVPKGWYSSYPGHSCKDVYDSVDARGDGEYWIDPEKNGNPLKVFCDMTRAGGEY